MFPFLGKNLIGYHYAGSGDHFFYGFNPEKEEQITTPFIPATAEEVEQAVSIAEKAFESYGRMPVDQRLRFIEQIALNVEKNREDLVRFFTLESGLPTDRAQGELTRSINQFRSYALALKDGLALEERLDAADWDRKPTPKPELYKKNVPLGPVVVFGASNFPFAYSTLGGDVASALVAGCPVIVKAHPMHPHTSALSAEVIRKAAEETGMPEGVFSHLQDDGYDVGTALVKHSKIRAVGFTGSIGGGTALVKIANERPVPIPVYAEMGSVNPILMTSEALRGDWNDIAIKIAGSVALNAGQFCTSPGFLLIQESENTSVFLEKLNGLFRSKEAQTMLHPGIFDRFKHRVEEHRSFVEEWVPVQFSGLKITPGLSRLPIDTFLNQAKAREELFGSYMNVVILNDEAELTACLNVFEGQLTASIFGGGAESLEDYIYLMTRFAGRIILNGVPTGVEVSNAQQHGGPFPSSSNPYFTAVGGDAVKRFMRPVAFQNARTQINF